MIAWWHMSRPHSEGANAERFWPFLGRLQVWELWGDNPLPTTYFEGGKFIFEGFRSPFDDVFEKFWFWLKSPRREVVRSSVGACVVYPPPLFGGSFSIPQGMILHILDVQALVKSFFLPILETIPQWIF